MPVTTKERLALVALAIAVLGVLIWFIWPSGRTRTELLQEAGYLEMVPPSKFHGPGTINTIELRSDGKVQLHPTCNIEDDRLAQYLIESPTEDHALVQYLNKGFDISAQIEGILSVNVDRNKTKKLFVSFQNVSILLMTDESLLLLQNEILRNTCRRL